MHKRFYKNNTISLYLKYLLCHIRKRNRSEVPVRKEGSIWQTRQL